PPYVGFHGFKEDKDYFRNMYEVCQGRFDIYLPFIERGIKLLKEGGLLGFICPTNFLKRQHGKALREFLKNNCKILQIVDFQDQRIFEEALNYTGIFIFEKSKPTSRHYLECEDLTVLVGPNGSGKSSFLRAIELFYALQTKVTEEDFYDKNTDHPIVISIVFSDLTQEELDLYEPYLDGNSLTVEKNIVSPGGKGYEKYFGLKMLNPDFQEVRSAVAARDKRTAYDKLRQEYTDLPHWRKTPHLPRESLSLLA
ncbi:unnamed protein product, partial [marine sediment metagenome]